MGGLFYFLDFTILSFLFVCFSQPEVELSGHHHHHAGDRKGHKHSGGHHTEVNTSGHTGTDRVTVDNLTFNNF